jgi:hypothetical protein
MFPLNNKLKAFLPVIIFALVAITLTSVLILITNKNDNNVSKDNKDNKKEKRELVKEKDKYGLSSLTEKFAVRNLKIEYCEDYEVKSISGLKNKEIEKKINQKITGCKYFMDDIIGDTISFIEYNDNYDIISGLSIRLDTGDEYDFEDIFLAEINIEQIISQAANYYFSCKYNIDGACRFMDDGDDEKNNKIPANFDMDEEIFRLINTYRDEGVEYFSVSHKFINFKIGKDDLFLPMESVWEKLAIYKRFLTKDNIFVEESNVTNYVLSIYQGNKYNGFVLDNLFLNEYKNEDDEIPDKVVSAITKQNDAIKDKIIEKAKSDKNNMYFISIVFYSYESDDNFFGNDSEITVYKMNKKDYERLGGEKFIADEQRDDKMVAGFYFAEDVATMVNIDDLILSNFKAVNKDGKISNSHCYLDNSWYKKGEIVEIWSSKHGGYHNFLVDDDCNLIAQD